MKKLKLFLGFIVLIETQSTFAAPWYKQKDWQTREWEKIKNELQDLVHQPVSSRAYEPRRPACDVKAVCDLMSQAKDRPYLYINRDQGKIPNYDLWEAGDTLTQSFLKSRLQKHFTFDVKVPEGKKPKSLLVQYLQARKAFQSSLEQNANFKQAYLDLIHQAFKKIEQKAMKEIMTEGYALEHSKGLEAHLRDQIDELAKLLDHPIPEGFKKLWIDYKLKKAALQDTQMIPEELVSDWQPFPKDPFANQRDFFSEKASNSPEAIQKNQARYQDKIAQTYALIQDVKSKMEEILLKYLAKKNFAKDAIETQKILSRLRNIQFHPKKLDLSLMYGECALPNAFYNPQENYLTICPALMDIPTEGLRTIIARELSTAIDPCTMTGDVYQISIEAPNSPTSYLADFASNQHQFTPKAPQSLDTDAEFGVDVLNLGPSALKESIEKRRLGGGITFHSLGGGILPPKVVISPEPISTGIETSKNPFFPLLECLAPSEAKPPLAKVKALIENTISQTQIQGITEANASEFEELQKILADLENIYVKRTVCGVAWAEVGKSQQQIAFSDWMVSKLLDQDLQQKDLGNRKQELAYDALAFLSLESCQIGQRSSLGKLIQQLTRLDSDLGSDEDLDEFKASPEVLERTHHILLANPSLRQTLGCKALQQEKYCE